MIAAARWYVLNLGNTFSLNQVLGRVGLVINTVTCMISFYHRSHFLPKLFVFKGGFLIVSTILSFRDFVHFARFFFDLAVILCVFGYLFVEQFHGDTNLTGKYHFLLRPHHVAWRLQIFHGLAEYQRHTSQSTIK